MSTSNAKSKEHHGNRPGLVLVSILAVAGQFLIFGAICLALVHLTNVDIREMATVLLIPALFLLPHGIVGLGLIFERKYRDHERDFRRNEKSDSVLFEPRGLLVAMGLTFISFVLLLYGVGFFFTDQSYVLGAALIVIGEVFAFWYAFGVGKAQQEAVFATLPTKDG